MREGPIVGKLSTATACDGGARRGGVDAGGPRRRRTAPLRVSRSAQSARPGAFHAVRVPDHRPHLRRQRPAAHRAGAGVPRDHAVRRHPADRARRDPGRRGQALLLPQRRGLLQHVRACSARSGSAHAGGTAGAAGGRRDTGAAAAMFPQGGSTITQQLVRGVFLAAPDVAGEQLPASAHRPRCLARCRR